VGLLVFAATASGQISGRLSVNIGGNFTAFNPNKSSIGEYRVRGLVQGDADIIAGATGTIEFIASDPILNIQSIVFTAESFGFRQLCTDPIRGVSKCNLPFIQITGQSIVTLEGTTVPVSVRTSINAIAGNGVGAQMFVTFDEPEFVGFSGKMGAIIEISSLTLRERPALP